MNTIKKKLFIFAAIILILFIVYIFVFVIPASYVRVGVIDGQAQRIELSEMRYLQHGSLTVYFQDEHEHLAREVMKALEQVWQVPQKELSFDLGPFRIALAAPRGEVVSWSGAIIEMTVFETFLEWVGWEAQVWPLWFSKKVQNLQEADQLALFGIYWAIPHEAVEFKIFRIMYHDRATRWIGDGLAEYISYTVSNELASQVRSRVLQARQKEIQTFLVLEQDRKIYDLTREFIYGEDHKDLPPVGYGISLAFWLHIAQQHGKSTIKTFWERVSQISRPSAQDAARILSELTGEDIWAKLQKMDLQEVLKTLEQAAGP